MYAWGSNGKGQCGQGHSTSPVSRPSKVINLEGKQINQISAGTSHSVAWTTLPPDRFAYTIYMLQTINTYWLDNKKK